MIPDKTLVKIIHLHLWYLIIYHVLALICFTASVLMFSCFFMRNAAWEFTLIGGILIIIGEVCRWNGRKQLQYIFSLDKYCKPSPSAKTATTSPSKNPTH